MKKLGELYTPKPNEKVISLIDADGFTLVADYPEGREGVSIFLRLYIKDKGSKSLAGSVNRVSTQESHGGHTILDNDDPRSRVTNFTFLEDEGFILKDDLVTHSKLENPVSVNDFVAFLIDNHTSDKMGYIRRKQFIDEKFVKLQFWLVDLDFSSLEVFDIEGSLRNLELKRSETQNPDPFLKYFQIPRNTLSLSVLVATLFSIIYYSAYYFHPTWTGRINPPDVTNLLVVLYVASVFVLLEFISNRTNLEIKNLDKKFKSRLGKKIASIYGFSQHQIKLDFSSLQKRETNRLKSLSKFIL